MNPLFKDIALTESDYFSAIVLYGRNVASYKFALADALFTVATEGKEFATIDELTVPFSNALCSHLKVQDKQSTSPTSRFLDTLRKFNNGEVNEAEKHSATVRLGFNNVLMHFML